MKKVLILFAVALAMVSCGRQGSKTQEPTEEKTVVVPPGMPVAPMQQVTPISEISIESNNPSDPNVPVLKMEEGKPLDLSQLMGQRKPLEEQAAERIDSIRYEAEQGKADYQYLYGVCLENGWGVAPNASEALGWYKKAAGQQQKAAFNCIGNLYRTGKGVKQDDKEAFGWFKRGAEAEDAQAMLNLGNCHYFGMGTQKDIAQAVKWWQESANYSNAFALAQMGDCYYYGIGVEKNLDNAVDYFTQASDRNIAGAQYRLGILYYIGEGVEQDLTYSELLMKKSRDGGMKEAQEFLEKNFKK